MSKTITAVLKHKQESASQMAGGCLFVLNKPKTLLPVELLRNIISELLVGAFDLLSNTKEKTDADEMVWEKELVRCLAHVSYYFREVTKEVVVKLLLLDAKDTSWVIKGTGALNEFHKFYTKLNDPTKRSSLHVPKIPLFEVYRHYRDAMNLWENIDLNNRPIVDIVHPHVKRLLLRARKSADSVQPRIVALHIIDKVKRANTVVNVSERLYDADSHLRQHLKGKREVEASPPGEEIANVKLSALKDGINAHLTAVEQLIPDIITNEIDSSSIQSIMQEFTRSPFNLDEHDIHARATRILEALNSTHP